MTDLPSDREVIEYSQDRLLAAINQHEQNIVEFARLTEAERERIRWIKAIIARKKELEANGELQLRPRGQSNHR